MCQNTIEISECIIIITEPTDLSRLDQNRIVCLTGGVKKSKIKK